MSGQFTESIVEASTLEWFEELGYPTLYAPEIAPDEPNAERQNYADVILRDRPAALSSPPCKNSNPNAAKNTPNFPPAATLSSLPTKRTALSTV